MEISKIQGFAVVLHVLVSVIGAQNFQFPSNFFNVEKDVQNTFREAGSGLGKQTAAVPESNSNFLDANFDAFSRMFGQTANGAPNNFRQQVQGGSPPGRQPESNFDNFFGRGRQQNSQQFPSGFKDQLPGDTGRNGGVGQRPSFTPEKIAELKKFAHDFIIQDREWLPDLLQLVFHTCVGGCDGCLNFREIDNKALKPSYNTIRALWAQSDVGQELSLADFFVLMGTVAVEIAINKSDDLMGVVSIAFQPGRSTCPNPDNYHNPHKFPKGDDKDSIDFLMREFGLPERKLAIALLGAHSLGACRKENSGFRGRWDNTPLTLDNHYYKSLADTPNWIAVPTNGTTQWNSTSENGPMMLHADLSLLYNFDIVDSQNRPSCLESQHCRHSTDAGQVNLYSASMQVWVEDFIEAFLIMVNKKPDPQPPRKLNAPV